MTNPERVPRPPFPGRHVVLGVTGGIAAYKAIELARGLTLAGAVVETVLTKSAREFVGPMSFAALTGQPVHTDLFDTGDPLLHIRLAREAELVVVAPATADLIARAAAGIADDLLTAVLLATLAPVLLCPAMNDRMYAHPLTGANLEKLAGIGYHVLGPTEGPLAWGEGTGRGRMEEPDTIVSEAARLLTGATPLTGRHVLVTAGPTREPIDPVRYVGNRSSGRMGFAFAAAARRLGAEVTIVTGPSSLPTPFGVVRVDVETAEQMLHAVSEALPLADVLVMAAAVVDFRPADVAGTKIKKEGGGISAVPLERTADILEKTRDLRKPGAVTVGFALETSDMIENARRKLDQKALDIVVANDATEPGAAFEVETNRVTILERSGTSEELPLLSKDEVAERVLKRVMDLLGSAG